MPDEKSLGGFFKFLYDEFVQKPANKMGQSIQAIQGLGNTSPQTFPQDLGKAIMGGLGVVSSPYTLADPLIEATGKATDPRIAQALALLASTRRGDLNKIAGGTQGLGKIAEETSKSAAYEGFLKKVFQRYRDESLGQGILDELEDAGKSAKAVADEYWGSTHKLMPPETQKKMERYLESLWGFKPGTGVGSVVATSKEGKAIVANSYEDLHKWTNVGPEIQYLEGTERGYVALMEFANRMIKEASKAITDTPKLIK